MLLRASKKKHEELFFPRLSIYIEVNMKKTGRGEKKKALGFVL